jgi:hypothetical protein
MALVWFPLHRVSSVLGGAAFAGAVCASLGLDGHAALAPTRLLPLAQAAGRQLAAAGHRRLLQVHGHSSCHQPATFELLAVREPSLNLQNFIPIRAARCTYSQTLSPLRPVMSAALALNLSATSGERLAPQMRQPERTVPQKQS